METRYAAWRLNHEAYRSLVVAAASLLSAACGDTAHRLGDGPVQTQDGSDLVTVHECEPGQLLEPIDDMEDGDGSIEFTAGRAGLWFAFNDHTGTQEPDIFAESFLMGKIEPPRQGSRFAAHTRGSGFTEWGAGLGLDLRVQQPYDASGYAGISFWARRTTSDALTVQLAIPDSATSPLGKQCDIEAELCHDDFGKLIDLTEEWAYYHYTWAEMTARDWSEQSYRGVESINPKKVYGIRFQVEKFIDFDFWIDDLSFMCRPE